MAKKQILTHVEIEKDIADALRNPPEESEASNKRYTVFTVIVAICLFIAECIYPFFIIWFLLALIVFGLGNGIYYYLRLKNQIKNLTINDYILTEETVHSVSEEHYRKERGGKHRRTVQVNNYTVRFESGRIWRIPKELYKWNEGLRTKAQGIYLTIHRGDTLILVTKKDTDKAVVAYHTDIFEYKSRPR